MKTLEDINLQGLRVFIRSDLNVPLDDRGQITDDTRIRQSCQAIAYCLQKGAKTMVTSHLGRPIEGQFDAKLSLAPIAHRLAEILKVKVTLIGWERPDPQVGEVLLLENCRFNQGEKKNDPRWAKTLADYCDVFVMDAFGTAHRAEATTVGIAQFAKIVCAGPLLAGEVGALERALESPKRPFFAIVGGSKVSTKLEVLENLADKVDRLIVSGGIANTLLLAQGINVGKSLVEAERLDTAKKLLAVCQDRGVEVPLPTDVVCAKAFSADALPTIKAVEHIEEDDMILDFGPNTMRSLCEDLQSAATIVWNGPIGVFEFPAFARGTEALANAIAQSPAFTLAGGGDTITAINRFQVAEKISYISTGGGAFLEYLGGLKLPGVEALRQRG